jgi:hypothetical protein
MSSEMEAKLRSLANLTDEQPSFVLWAGSLEDAAKWEKLIAYLASVANDSAETGYDTEPLKDDLGLLSWHTFHTLKGMGVTIPSRFPVELDFDYEARSDEKAEIFESHPLVSLIFDIFFR